MSALVKICCGIMCGVCLTAMAQVERCRTLIPDVSLFQGAGVSSRVRPLRAVEKEETRLDVVDILVAYDNSARNWRESHGKGGAESFARARIDQMNACLANSGLDKVFMFRLAGVVEVDVNAGRMDLGHVIDLLIQGDGSVVARGEWAKIPARREECGADIVCILVACGANGQLGLGYSLEEKMFADDLSLIPLFGDVAYNISSIETAESDLTMLHEVAHNMGCGHPDKKVASPDSFWGYSYEVDRFVSGGDLGPQLFPYSAGFYFWVAGVGYYTIMAYNFGGLRPDGTYVPSDRFQLVPFFSSPDCTYEGVPLGTPLNDNVRTLRKTCQYVARYRLSAESRGKSIDEPIWTPFSYAKSCSFSAFATDDQGRIEGIVRVKVGKTSSRTQVSKVSATYTGIDAKTETTRAQRVDLSVSGTTLLEFRKSGRVLEVNLAPDGFSGCLNDVQLHECKGTILPDGNHAISLGEFPAQLDGRGVCKDLLPTNETFEVKRGKWMFNKASSVKYRKGPDQGAGRSYRLEVDRSKGRTNESGLRLSFSARNGVFKGKFKVYATNAEGEFEGRKPTLKKYSVSVTGIVANGVAEGLAVLRKPMVQTRIEGR